MSCPSSGPQDASGSARFDAPQTASAQGPVDRSLLERVLRQTLDLSDSGTPLDNVDRQALLAVAERHGDLPFSLEPVAVELVQAVLGTHFRRLSGEPDFWRAVSAQVAGVLVDDPVAGPRLETLWNHLVRMRS